MLALLFRGSTTLSNWQGEGFVMLGLLNTGLIIIDTGPPPVTTEWPAIMMSHL